jgi:2-oxoglutarate dehydrogenase E1 component
MILRANYCGKVGLEYMHIADVEERRFLQDRIEGADKSSTSPPRQEGDPSAVIRGEQYEKFLGKQVRRHQALRPRWRRIDDPGAGSGDQVRRPAGVKEIVYGMAHRGRLNVLANVMAKPYRVIFHEFSGGTANPEDVGGSGDVKYHLGTSTDREFDGIKVHMSLVPNPSHLETVDPVVLGKVRATLTMRR